MCLGVRPADAGGQSQAGNGMHRVDITPSSCLGQEHAWRFTASEGGTFTITLARNGSSPASPRPHLHDCRRFRNHSERRRHILTAMVRGEPGRRISDPRRPAPGRMPDGQQHAHIGFLRTVQAGTRAVRRRARTGIRRRKGGHRRPTGSAAELHGKRVVSRAELPGQSGVSGRNRLPRDAPTPGPEARPSTRRAAFRSLVDGISLGTPAGHRARRPQHHPVQD